MVIKFILLIMQGFTCYETEVGRLFSLREVKQRLCIYVAPKLCWGNHWSTPRRAQSADLIFRDRVRWWTGHSPVGCSEEHRCLHCGCRLGAVNVECERDATVGKKQWNTLSSPVDLCNLPPVFCWYHACSKYFSWLFFCCCYL